MNKLVFIPQHTRQHESEIMEMVDFLWNTDLIKTVIEIGCFEGGTTYLWAQLVKGYEGKVFTIDVQFGPGDKAEPEARDRCLPIYRGTDVEQYVTEIEGKSNAGDTLDRLSMFLSGKTADLLFIDGGHLWTDIQFDFEVYSCFVRENGWIAIHDIANPGTPSVKAYWEEKIKPHFETWEFILEKQLKVEQKTIWTEEPTCGIGLMRWRR